MKVYSRKATLSLKISEFEVPPMQDLLIIGKKAPIGPEAVKRMAQALSPEQFRSSHPNRIVADAMTPNPISILPSQFAWDALEKDGRASH